MAVLYYTDPSTYGYSDICVGYHLEENLTDSGVVLVRDVIYADYLSIEPTPPVLWFISAVFAPISFVTSFDNEYVKMTRGNPPSYQFGSINFNHLGTFADRHFISYESQQYPLKEQLVSPEPLDFPSTMSGLPSPEQVSLIFRTTSYGVRTANPKSSFYTACLKFNYELRPSVIANIGFFYYAYVNIAGDPGSDTYTGIAL